MGGPQTFWDSRSSWHATGGWLITWRGRAGQLTCEDARVVTVTMCQPLRKFVRGVLLRMSLEPTTPSAGQHTAGLR